MNEQEIKKMLGTLAELYAQRDAATLQKQANG